MTELKSELVARATGLGFDLCRVARCDAPPHAGEFRQWLAEGNAGEMSWLERNKERRTDPAQVLPGARSVIVLGMNYFQGDAGNGAPPPGDGIQDGEQRRGVVARYAWGDDYHGIIEARMKELDAWLAGMGGAQKCYVDTGPVLERDFAALAGVGWHG